ncbi:phosphatase PAP2 family protein [Sphingomonas sp. HITSZ_GF]|uniref:phosphatase PAP2 family protein n=1 Tax=Sphingomonas sp. HITSZ_GF TaxID=3037247 RepID=UPI00240D72E3|nr:phosphatase PAP2 family protein [Sphingomonas sp. HITSZ_GF]MDG2535728.1 phosphatase PAP2 family protein [Sphingomonas sp. HITSZ_GF]
MHPAPEAPPASRRLPWPILAAAGFALFLLALLWFGHELVEGDGATVDRAILLAMRVPGHPLQPIGPAWLPSAVRDVTALGSTTVLTFIVVVAAIFLGLAGRLRTALLVVTASLLGSVAVETIRAFIARPRPELTGQLMEVSSHSFPSGHAAISAIVYLTLATLLFPVLPDRRIRGFALVVALVLTAAIGLSRLYLGVHWPSDVLAGWAFGGVWAMIWWRIELALLTRARASAMLEI